jgi:hypothetical protein
LRHTAGKPWQYRFSDQVFPAYSCAKARTQKGPDSHGDRQDS